MSIRRVHFTTGDDVGWAIDEDLRLLRGSLNGVCESTSMARAEAVHAVWWQRLLRFSRSDFRGKHVLCYADNAPFIYASGPEFLKARELVTLWIARSREAVAQFTTLGIASRFAPYTFDPAVFRPLAPDDSEMRALVAKWRIPTDKYLIANFHRDTEGGDLQSPKLQKGPDAFLEIVARLHDEGADIHVLLAGPRRFYLRTQLAQRGVPFTFIGHETHGRDDLGINILPRATLNTLYNIADLHLITSRWEGGPHSVLESAGARCKVVSTPVGIAPDVLAPECLFSSLPEACEIIRRDLRDDSLATFIEPHHERAHTHHTGPALRRHLVEIYGALDPLPAPRGAIATLTESVRHLVGRIRSRLAPHVPPLSIAILDRPASDARLTQLGDELKKCGCAVAHNEMPPGTNGVLLGELAPDDPLAATLPRRADIPVIGFLRAPAAGDQSLPRRPLDTCTILPSLDALAWLRKRDALPRRALVLSLPAPAQAEDRAHDAEPLIVPPGDAWAADRILQALAQGRPVLYPADSHYEWLVWFAGLAYRSEAALSQNLDTLRAHSAMFTRMLPPAASPAHAECLVRLFHVCREILNDENRT
jgi:hypothetical protein